MFMLTKMPKIFFILIKIFNISFFSFIVYLTLFEHRADIATYLYVLLFYGILLVFHAVGSYMNEETQSIIEDCYYYEDSEEFFEEENL